MRLATSWESFDLSRNPTIFFFSNKTRERLSISSRELKKKGIRVGSGASTTVPTWRVPRVAALPQNQPHPQRMQGYLSISSATV